MKKLKYSQDAREKLKQIKRYVAQNFGTDTANKVIKEMTKSFRDLQQYENKGVSMESVLGISCDYRMLYGSFLVLRLLQKKLRIIGKSNGNKEYADENDSR